MSRLKDMWIEAYNDLFDELVENGISEDEAAEVASRAAGSRAQDRIADMIDAERLRKKEGMS